MLSPAFDRWILVPVLVIAACPAADAPATPAPIAAPAVVDAPVPTAAPDAPPIAVAPPIAAPVPKPTPTPAPVDPTRRFALAVAGLVGGASPPGADAKAAWAHYEAGRFADAQRGFAALALADPKPWKHPFNLACSAAKAGDNALARAGLVEAIRRGGTPAVDKARRDADLASVRTAAWFEPVMRGEDPSPEPTPSVGPPVVATPTTPPVTPPVSPPVSPPTGGAPVEPDDLPGADAAIEAELASADLTTLKAKLAEVHGAPVVIRRSLELPAEGGTREVYAVYDFSRYTQCLKASSKKACRKKLMAGSGETRMECTDQWLVRAALGTTWEIREKGAIPIGCDTKRVNQLLALDLDRDGALEIFVDVVGSYYYEEVRDEVTEYVRIARVLRRDGSVQLEMRTEYREAFMGGDNEARRFYFADADGDAHADVVVQDVDFSGMEAGVDDELWPALEDGHPVVSKVTRYDPKSDSWPGLGKR